MPVLLQNINISHTTPPFRVPTFLPSKQHQILTIKDTSWQALHNHTTHTHPNIDPVFFCEPLTPTVLFRVEPTRARPPARPRRRAARAPPTPVYHAACTPRSRASPDARGWRAGPARRRQLLRPVPPVPDAQEARAAPRREERGHADLVVAAAPKLRGRPPRRARRAMRRRHGSARRRPAGRVAPLHRR